MSNINDINLISRLKSLRPAEFKRPDEGKLEAGRGGPNFSQVLKTAIEEVSGLEREADTALQKLATGSSDNIHEAMIALQKANLSFKAMMEVRDKLISAYKEIMRTPV